MLRTLLQSLGGTSGHRQVGPGSRRRDTGRLVFESLEARLVLSGNPIVSVDFGSADAETGFVQQSITNQTHTTTAGDLTVDVSGVQGLFDFATTGTNDDLYRDFYFKNSGTITMTLSGIAISANTDYDLTFWSYYGAQGRDTTFDPASGTTGPSLGPIADSNTPAPSLLLDPLYSVTGTYTSDGTGSLTIDVGGTGNRPAINGFKIVTNGPDNSPPMLLPGNIVDDQGGGPVNENTLVTYTLTFDEDIDESTVDASDFSNAGTATVSFGAVTETSPGVFTVAVAPTAAGTLQLQVPVGASIMDPAGNSLDTASAIVDDTSINVVVAPPDNTAPTPDPMSFATVPYTSSETSIAMVATTATDIAGVEYYFTETSGNSGGDDSGWQGSTTYEDSGLTTGLQYTYTVTARDLSSNQNATDPSGSASAIAQTPIVAPTITTPTTRQIVQRSATTNLGAIEIEGTYSIGVPNRIEARMVVMTGSGNNGTTTAWQTIDASPSGGTYSGTLIDVPAGGWYQLEVRSVIGSTPSTAAVLDKVGVGDIYVTAGQSNSANFAAGQAPQDDRISARTSTTDSTWTLATSPLPISNGGGGSVWTWLGNKLIAAEDIPIGLVSLGQGGSPASSWTAGGGNYNARLKPAVQSFEVDGFRAALWHQGETDSIQGVSATTHFGYLNGMVSQSRIDAGWSIPWYLAEASFHPSSNISAQEPIAAGQRLTIHGDALTYFGPSTDELHLTGGGSLHFNAVGTDAHAQGWSDILLGNVTVTPENGNFEEHGWIEYATPNDTSPTPLADGNSMVVDLTTTGQILRVLDWRILAASGLTAADGSNGFHNPTTGTYAGAIDTINGGVLPNMDGKHVALLDAGTADNYFLQSTRAAAEPDTLYTLTVALGVRDNPVDFGGARLEITADGVVVATSIFDKAALDALHGSDASGTFTDASVSWTTGSTVAANQPLAFRIVKEGGAGTLLDFDNARFTAEAACDPVDFDCDGVVDIDDVNALTLVGDLSVGVTVTQANAKFDLNGDNLVNTADLNQWLADAATFNGHSSAYLKGDANLDADVDVFQLDGNGDAQILSSNLGTLSGAVWGDGDFNGDGDVDVFQLDGNGDAQLLSSNLGNSNDVGESAAGMSAALNTSDTKLPSSGSTEFVGPDLFGNSGDNGNELAMALPEQAPPIAAAIVANYRRYDVGHVEIAELTIANHLRAIDEFMSRIGNSNDWASLAINSAASPLEVLAVDAGRFDAVMALDRGHGESRTRTAHLGKYGFQSKLTKQVLNATLDSYFAFDLESDLASDVLV